MMPRRVVAAAGMMAPVMPGTGALYCPVCVIKPITPVGIRKSVLTPGALEALGNLGGRPWASSSAHRRRLLGAGGVA